MPPAFAAPTLPDAVSVPLFRTVPFRKKRLPLVHVAFVWFSKTRLSVTAPLVGANPNVAPGVSSVVPVPLIVPLFQLKAPFTVMFPLPVKVPPARSSWLTDKAVLIVVVPAPTAKSPVCNTGPKVVVPLLVIAPT